MCFVMDLVSTINTSSIPPAICDFWAEKGVENFRCDFPWDWKDV